jgi:hypothetical protein
MPKRREWDLDPVPGVEARIEGTEFTDSCVRPARGLGMCAGRKCRWDLFTPSDHPKSTLGQVR